jgi:thiol peroxidase
MPDSTTEGIRVRPATADDKDFVLALAPQLVASSPPPWRDSRQMTDTDTLVIGSALQGLMVGATVFVAEDTGGRPLGFILVCDEPDYYTRADCGHIADLVVAPDARGRGVGEALIAAAEQWARAGGYSLLTLNVFIENIHARALYERTGFGAETVRYVKVLEGGHVDHERTGEAFEGDIRLTVIGRRLNPGDAAPDFVLDALAPGEAIPREITLASGRGRVRLLHVVNSLDTPVCHIGAHRFDKMRTADLPSGVDVYTVSMDLPFAQARWRAAEGVQHEALSSHRSEAFGRAYGVLLREWRLLQRAVFVIDGRGRIVYAEYVADQMAEPDYAAAVAAARAIAQKS